MLLKNMLRNLASVPKNYFMDRLYLKKVIRDRKTCVSNVIVVAGMPRSGTSLLSAILKCTS